MDDKRCLPGSRSEAHWERRIRGLANNHDLRGCLEGLQGLGWARYSWSHNKQASLYLGLGEEIKTPGVWGSWKLLLFG